MASRLYRSTRGLYQHTVRHLRQLRVEEIGSPTFVALIALYVTGLTLCVLDTRQTQTRVTRTLPGRCHDALNRLLRAMPFSTRALMGLLVAWVKRQGLSGYLCLDDVIVEKAFAKRLKWAGWGYSFAKKRQVYGVHIIVCLWCSFDGQWRIPVAFRLRRPKRSVSPADYRTKVQLADEMIVELLTTGLSFEYIVFDTHYTAGWFTKKLAQRGICWQGTLNPRTHVVWRGRKQSVADLAPRLKLRWRPALQLRAIALRVYAPTYGYLRLVVTQNRHGNFEYLVSHDRSLDLTTMALHCGVQHVCCASTVAGRSRPCSATRSNTLAFKPASAGLIKLWCVMSASRCSRSHSCNSCVNLRTRVLVPSKNDGN